MIINFLVQEKLMYYGPSEKLLSDNNTNFLANIIWYIISDLIVKSKILTLS